MRKLVVTEYITLDGVFENPGNWSFDFWSDQAAAFKKDELWAADIQLLGRITYQGFADAWPKMEEQTGEFGVRMNTMPKYVVSTTLTDDQATWQNSTVIRDNIKDSIHELKNQDGGNILVAGSGQLVQFLMQNNLVDDYYFMIHPLVLGKGQQLFTNAEDNKLLKLVDMQKFDKGIIVLHYQPTIG